MICECLFTFECLDNCGDGDMKGNVMQEVSMGYLCSFGRVRWFRCHIGFGNKGKYCE